MGRGFEEEGRIARPEEHREMEGRCCLHTGTEEIVRLMTGRQSNGGESSIGTHMDETSTQEGEEKRVDEGDPVIKGCPPHVPRGLQYEISASCERLWIKAPCEELFLFFYERHLSQI